ncbi:MAG TPA: M14 family zinc carboxypeptidase [Rubricoccaceae bacterium]|nr:M14 family zinc carboxypeptidase [Rubricoccaceae bacterium]
MRALPALGSLLALWVLSALVVLPAPPLRAQPSPEYYDDLAAHDLATGQGSCQAGRPLGRIEADLCGPMGGYLTFDGVVAALDALRAQYPDIVSAKTSLGQSHEGRDVWLVEVTDHPVVDEGEPEVLFTGLHHANEPGAMMAVLYTMYYLAEQYATNPAVRALVRNRRLFFVPVVNPDGYAYNEQTDPSGGGMWRKNLRDNGDGSFGVDLNRNYGYGWGWSNTSSSPDPSSLTYRGPEPFSEPETRAIRDFAEGGRRLAVTVDYHTHGGYFAYPTAGRAEVALAVAEAQAVTVSVYDALGRRVALLHDGPLAAGVEHRLTFDGAGLPVGVYVVRAVGEAFADTRILTLTR